ncbi:MAG: von Willebrand factor type A domain-containing protein [Verrucomicrobiales bacterium]|nr:von Willebrand factor type A domain-containing protein [Verrucomicrobiales bacterium]
MKLSPDSPELTAYVLNELPPAERALVESALQESDALRAEVDQLREVAERMVDAFATEPVTALTPEQRRRILEQGRPPMPRASGASASPGESPLVAWYRILRAHWAWATTALAALAVTLIALRPDRSADHRFQELRYQVRPAPETAVPETASRSPAQPTNPPVAEHDVDAVASSLSYSLLSGASSPVIPPSDSLAAAADKQTWVISETPVRETPPESREFSVQNNAPEKTAIPRARVLQESLQRSETPQLGQAVVRFKESAASEPSVDDDFYFSGFYPKGFAGPVLTATDPDLPRHLALTVSSAGQVSRTPPSAESYASVHENVFKSPATAPLSTFSLDVDTASYANVRRFLREGSLPPPDAVRIEELINYFRYDYPQAKSGEPFGTDIEIAECPWREGNKLVRIGLQAPKLEPRERPRANLVFLLDVSGSMEPENKLPLVQRSLRLLLDRLGERDSVGIVTYAGESRVALEPIPVTDAGRQRIRAVIEGFRAGSGTAGSVGIQNAYALATNHFIPGGANRVILCTDGDFNIGITDPQELHRLIEEKAKSGVFLSVLGFGMQNLKDSTMEMLADKGNGNYAYVDSFSEARKVLGEQLEGTLITVAKDVKVQVEFNPARVRSYRLIGYENRALRDRDFNDDTKDAGDVGAGHQVTVLYEIEPATPHLAGTDPLRYQPQPEAPAPKLKPGHEEELLNLKIRYKAPEGEKSRLIERPVQDTGGVLARASADFKFAAAVAGYGMLLRNSPQTGPWGWNDVLSLAEQGLGTDREGYRAEFVDLVRTAQKLSNRK